MLNIVFYTITFPSLLPFSSGFIFMVVILLFLSPFPFSFLTLGTHSLHIDQLHENAVFEQVTKNAVRGIWARRSKLNLVGAHINVFTGEWTQKVTFCLT